MKIVVLEDMQVRVDWLRSAFPDFEVVWHTNVREFVACLRSGIEPAFVVLDHDLDTADPNARPGQLHDKDGLTGADAARMMPKLGCFAVVWSANAEGARQIESKLEGKVEEPIIREPWSNDAKALTSLKRKIRVASNRRERRARQEFFND